MAQQKADVILYNINILLGFYSYFSLKVKGCDFFKTNLSIIRQFKKPAPGMLQLDSTYPSN